MMLSALTSTMLLSMLLQHSFGFQTAASNYQRIRTTSTPLLSGVVALSSPLPCPSEYNSIEGFNQAIHRFCQDRSSVFSAIDLLRSAESQSDGDALMAIPNIETYVTILKALVLQRYPPSLSEEVFDSMKKNCGQVNVHACNAVIATWARSREPAAPQRAEQLLAELWQLYDSTADSQFLPNRATYMGVMTSWAWCGTGVTAARRTEELLEEMEAHREIHRFLAPTTPFVNAVLNAWSKSQAQGATERSEIILNRMVKLARSGRRELEPDTVSFNTVIACLARSGEHNAEWRAEELLGRMDELARLGIPSEPDTVSFNTVLSAWSKSRQRNAAQRAEDILKHMERRYESRTTKIVPDTTSYTSVIHAWSRSGHPQRHEKAGNILARMHAAYKRGNEDAKPNAMVYNTMINVWAKSQDPNSAKLAMNILGLMRKQGLRPDVFTYTSLMDLYAKQGTLEAAEKARALLDEMEREYNETGIREIKPNVRTYTSVINAIARTRKNPQEAEAILDRMLDANVQPDVVCYNAVINAYGWSDLEGKEQHAYAVLDRMLRSYKSGNTYSKPDIITCNSILNSCAFAIGNDRAAAMLVAINTLEKFQSAAPEFGWPNHITFGSMLTAISRQMPQSEKRCDLAEATFWQCCEAGHVSTLVVHSLRGAVTPQRLKKILGSALIANNEHLFKFEMRELPAKWKQFAPRKAHNASLKRMTKPSARQNEPEITKQYCDNPPS